MYYHLFRFIYYPTPWISPATTVILKNILSHDHVGLEYGSGLSSVFLSKRVGHLVSIEHYEPWYKRVDSLLEKHGLTNVDRRLIKPKQIKELPQNPTKAEQNEIQYGHTYYDYTQYSKLVNEFPDEHFDFAIIDGRARVNCMLNSIPKVKKGGFIILDNSDRPYYSTIHKMLNKYPHIHSTTGLFDTTIWFKTD